MHFKLNCGGDELYFIRQTDMIGQTVIWGAATTRKTGLVHEERAACTGER